MHVTTVESTTLATVAYDKARGLLQLEFFVAGRFINTSALPQQCTKPCWVRPPRAATSTGSFVDAFPIL